jgi:hypothetical protein
VLVPYLTLIGLADTPGELDGFGPIPASVARRLAAGGVWRHILTDPATGQGLDYGRTRYRPPQDLIDHVVARDRTCRGIGCDRPARSCQIDHTIPTQMGPLPRATPARSATGNTCSKPTAAGRSANRRPPSSSGGPHQAYLHQTPRSDRAHHRQPRQ